MATLFSATRLQHTSRPRNRPLAAVQDGSRGCRVLVEPRNCACDERPIIIYFATDVTSLHHHNNFSEAQEFATQPAAIPTLFPCRVQDRIGPCPSTWRELVLYAIVTVVRRPCYLFCGCRGTEGGDSPPSRRVRCGARHAPMPMDHWVLHSTPTNHTHTTTQHSFQLAVRYPQASF